MALLSCAKRGLPLCKSNAVAKTKAAEVTETSIWPRYLACIRNTNQSVSNIHQPSIPEVITYKYVLEALHISVLMIQIEAKQTYKAKIQITPQIWGIFMIGT